MKQPFKYSIRRLMVAAAVAGGVLLLFPEGCPWIAGATAISYAGIVLLTTRDIVRRTLFSVMWGIIGAGICGFWPRVSNGFDWIRNDILVSIPVPEEFLIGAFLGWFAYTWYWHLAEFSKRHAVVGNEDRD